jgi:hypothetical protein
MEEEIADRCFGVLGNDGLPLRFDDLSYGQSGDDDPAVTLLCVFKNTLADIRPRSSSSAIRDIKLVESQYRRMGSLNY